MDYQQNLNDFQVNLKDMVLSLFLMIDLLVNPKNKIKEKTKIITRIEKKKVLSTYMLIFKKST